MHALRCAQSMGKHMSYHGASNRASRAAKQPDHPAVQLWEVSPRFFPALRSHTVPAAGTPANACNAPPASDLVSDASTTSCSSKPGPMPAAESLAVTYLTSAHSRNQPLQSGWRRGDGGGAARVDAVRGAGGVTPVQAGSQRGWTHSPHHAAECVASLQPGQGRCSLSVLPAQLPSRRDATPGPVPWSFLQRGSPPCQGMRDPCSEGCTCQGGSSSLQSFRKGTGLPTESYPNMLDSILLQGTISQLQDVFSPDTCAGGAQAGTEEQDRQAGSLDAGLGIPGAKPRGWHEKKWVQTGHGHMEARKRRQLLPD